MRSKSSLEPTHDALIDVLIELDETTWEKKTSKLRALARLTIQKAIKGLQSTSAAARDLMLKISNINNLTEEELDQSKKITVHRAMCVGFASDEKPAEILAEAKSARKKGYEFRVYLDVKVKKYDSEGNPRSLEETLREREEIIDGWKNKNKALMEFLEVTHFNQGSKIVTLEEYAKEEKFQIAKTAFQLHQGKNDAFISKLIAEEGSRLSAKYHFSVREMEEHLTNGMIAIVSWCELLSDPSRSSKFNILLYGHGNESGNGGSGHWIKDYIKEIAKLMGFDPETFIHLHPKYQALTPKAVPMPLLSLTLDPSSSYYLALEAHRLAQEAIIRRLIECYMKDAKAMLCNSFDTYQQALQDAKLAYQSGNPRMFQAQSTRVVRSVSVSALEEALEQQSTSPSITA